MRHPILFTAAVAMLSLSACKKAEDAKPADPTAGEDTVLVPDESAPDTADATPATADLAGKWIGPEGMYVDVKSTGEGKFSLDMQSDLDTKGTYEGTAVDGGIQFKRGAETLLLKKSDGDATGMKWLAGKKDCLMVKTGEGYCRG